MNKAAYAVKYTTIEPLIELVNYNNSISAPDEMYVDNIDVETQLATMLLNPTEYITNKLNDMVQWGIDLLWDKISYLVSLGLPMKQAKMLTVKLFESLGLVIIILEY